MSSGAKGTTADQFLAAGCTVCGIVMSASVPQPAIIIWTLSIYLYKIKMQSCIYGKYLAEGSSSELVSLFNLTLKWQVRNWNYIVVKL